MSTELEALKRRVALPAGWQLSDSLIETTSVGGLQILVAGLVAEKGELSAFGSAAHSELDPAPRAYYELIERAVLLDAMQSTTPLCVRNEQGVQLEEHDPGEVFPQSPEPTHWQYAKSNGVALGQNWADACERAMLELIERDLVLRAWYGQLLPQRCSVDWFHAELAESYDFEVYGLERDGFHAGLALGWPKASHAPLLLGLSAAREPEAALRSAYHEALQRLGFLWGEDIPEKEPPFEPTPGYHQEYYLWPARHTALRHWLAGDHRPHATGLAAPGKLSAQDFRFVDLADIGGLRVVKALNPQCLPAVFGRGGPFARGLPEALSVHPIA